jgi:hypothetical protein
MEPHGKRHSTTLKCGKFNWSIHGSSATKLVFQAYKNTKNITRQVIKYTHTRTDSSASLVWAVQDCDHGKFRRKCYIVHLKHDKFLFKN